MSAATFFPDTTASPRSYRLLRTACEPPGMTAGSPPAPQDVSPLGEVLEYAITAKMTCLVIDLLHRHDLTSDMPRPMQQFLRAQRRLNTHRWRLHHNEAARIIDALAQHGIRAAAINGIAHASLLYDGGARQSSDVDILIPPGDDTAAAAILAARGYHRTERRPTALHRDFDDPLVPGLTLDLTTRLAHTPDTANIAAALARRTTAPPRPGAAEVLPVLSRADGFAHTLARVAAQRRWPALADALRYSTDGVGSPAPVTALSAPAQAGWQLLRSCWPHLPKLPPLTQAGGEHR